MEPYDGCARCNGHDGSPIYSVSITGSFIPELGPHGIYFETLSVAHYFYPSW